jgi:hypothetical protein
MNASRVKENENFRTNGMFFKSINDGKTVEVIDPIDNHRYAFETSGPISAEPVGTEQFFFPVDTAVTLSTETITLSTGIAVCVRDDAGTFQTEVKHFTQQEFPADTYWLEISAPIQLHLQVTSALTITVKNQQTFIEFADTTQLLVGACSRHEHPAATITTTDSPADMMTAVSQFSSALRTTSPERSYPSYRGHPPTIEIGESLDIPSHLSSPDTGLQIEVPPDYQSIYVVAPLAYYLGADLVAGDTPQLVSDTGFTYTFGTDCEFERDVERVLKHIFFLDCITRTEGMYQVDLHERQAIEPHINLDFATLYNQPLTERTETYLTIPFSHLEDHIPEWKLTTYIEPTPERVEMLPFAVNDLAIVQTPEKSEASPSEEEIIAVDDFLRNDDFVRGTNTETSNETTYYRPRASDSLEKVWFGEGTPLGASKAMISAYQNRLSRTPTSGNIEITVVCNDSLLATSRMSGAGVREEEKIVDEIYGSRADFPFDVTVHHGLTTNQFKSVISSSSDFFHYIGHVDEKGFACADGSFDAAIVDSVGINAFFLNACNSYEQAKHLIESGAIGGIATLTDILNKEAISIGGVLARLLNLGFPLDAALKIASNEIFLGNQYLVVGDGGVALAQTETGTPNLCEVEPTDNGFTIDYKTYPTTQLGIGSMILPHTEQNGEFFLNSGIVGTFSMSEKELQRFLALENIPVLIDGELQWSYSTDVAALST